jgi:ESS family glutamate:Na+ symporter
VEFWRGGVIPNLVMLAVLLAAVGVLRRHVRLWARLGVPDSIAAGALGFCVGPSVLGLAPLDPRELELIVYHAFAIVFIAVGLQRAQRHAARGGARSLAFALPGMAVLQSLLGFAMLAVIALVAGETLADGTPLHPGFGFMLMLGFSQGPGQALSFGGAWEHAGMAHGAQIGLTFAALGFAACVAIGVPLVAYGRRRGWIEAPGFGERDGDPAVADDAHTIAAHPQTDDDGMDPLTRQIVAIGSVYALVFVVLWLVTRWLPSDHPLVASSWGFHFLVGSALAILTRRTADRLAPHHGLDDRLLARISVTAVDFTTAAALAAIELDVVGRYLAPILVMAVVGALVTLVVCVWYARRAFPEAPFAHCLVLFGTATGTMPTGFALLRMVDPGLRGPVARSTVVAATASIPLGAPLFIGVIPFVVSRWSLGFWPSVTLPLVIIAIYLVVLVVLARRFTPFRALRPLASAWPPSPEALQRPSRDRTST